MATAWRTYSSELSQLAVMRDFVGETCRQEWANPADESIIFQLQLVLTEAATNVIRHAYQGQSGQPIELMLETHADQVRLTLYYNGQAFDPRTVSPPDFDGSREGGFGVYMMEQWVDQVTYFLEDDGRRAVRLVKKRTKTV
jgi:anti-sigma regulatory factor (Ser/Thr protein kinase)